MSRLEGKTALITGATSGIGLATAKLFHKEGARLVITGQNQERLNQAAQELGSETLAIRVDVRSLADIETMVSKIESHFGSLDVLFVNAGIAKLGPMIDASEELIDEVMSINFKGAFLTIQKAATIMHNQGSIVLNTSVNNQMGMANSSIYAASKAALRSLARTLSAELIERGIRVNAVSPGPVMTPIYGKLGVPQEHLNEFAGQLQQQIPMKRFGNPEEIAKAVLFLASDDSSFVLGEELVVDGGWTEL
ncbi:MAG: SDR family oxidoreductase [Symploca sp. SIO2E9]|nr:SDR family oxidoreductase [Symploca sp. SIO2E9]